MLQISNFILHNSSFVYDRFKDNMYNLGKNVLNYSVRHQYSLSAYIWSYFLIEIGRTAAITNFGEDYVYNLDTCRDKLCNSYWNNSEKIDNFFYSPTAEFRCSEQGYSSYSFLECLKDLCEYFAIVGENFYACMQTSGLTEIFPFNETTEEIKPDIELSFTLIDYWNKICPKKHFRRSDKPTPKLKELAYLTHCLEKLCTPDNLIKFESNKEILGLCANKDIMKLYDLLHRMSRAIKKLQKVTLEENADTTELITNIIVALATVVGGAATIGAAIITYRTSKAAHILQHAIPSLDEGVRTISRAAADTSRAIIRGTSIVQEMLPPETLKTLNELSSNLAQMSSSSSFSSFSSARENLSPQPGISVRFDPNIKVINVVGGGIGVGTGNIIGGGIGVGTGNIIGGGIGVGTGNIIGGGIGVGTGSIISVVGTSNGKGSGGKQEQFEFDETIEKITSTTSSIIKELVPSLEPFSFNLSAINLPIFNITEGWWFSYLKNTLPNWQDAYCYYEGIEKFLFCKFPRPSFDHYISFFLETLKEFFSKNTDVLCIPLNEELWCNWGHFLDLILSKRNITFTYPNCEWDHFGLQIDKISNDTYFFEASGTCYNETNLLKV